MSDGEAVGLLVGLFVVGLDVGDGVGLRVGDGVGLRVGDDVGLRVVGGAVGVRVVCSLRRMLPT